MAKRKRHGFDYMTRGASRRWARGSWRPRRGGRGFRR